MEKHYVCSGTCGGSADAPTNCGDMDCPQNGQPMTECDCEGGAMAHKGMGEEVGGREEKTSGGDE